MPSVRYRSTTFAALANLATDEFMFVTPDDNQPRKLTGILAPNNEDPGAIVRVQRAGYSAAEIDGTMFDTAYGFIDLDLDFPVGIQFEVDLINNSGATTGVMPVTIRYEV